MGGGHHPTVARVDLVEFLEPAFPQNFEKKFVREKSFLFLGRGDPIFDDHLLDLADGILLRNAGIGHAVEMTAQQLFLGLRAQLAVVGYAFVLAARDQIKEVLLQVRAGAGNGMDFILTNHFSEGDTQLGRAHRASERDHHFPAAIEMRDVGVGSVFEDCRVEVPIMAVNELADATCFHAINFCDLFVHCRFTRDL